MQSATAAEIDDWYRGKDLPADWLTHHLPHILPILAPLRGRSVKVLEIGSYEGRSALFFLNYLPHATIVCIDPWDPAIINNPKILDLMPEAAGQPDKMAWALAEYAHVEGRFDRNLAPFGTRATKIKGWSQDVLPGLALRGEIFDVIYVDGDHRAASSYRDCVLAWPLIAAGGIMMIDDYAFMPSLPEADRPEKGVDAFLRSIRWRFEELHRGYQIIIQATRPGDLL